MKNFSKIKLQAKEKQAIISFSKNLKKLLGKQLISIQLFGSKARGDYNGDSDIDIFILIRKQTLSSIKIIAKVTSDIWWEYDILMSPVMYDLEEYDRNVGMHSFFFEALSKEGVVI